uniref:Uncharacterized protein n=1 Tax=Tetraselmis sp. GSL018 TaxID=582737 RepID=A0A061RD58_9CHLO|mmetsp:Transcript_11988/g.28434  ORF Transcript_11988/g.28434 Transcript_11988/m.28434 type:complete len:270 (+) Transcript_11988:623-1432(+)
MTGSLDPQEWALALLQDAKLKHHTTGRVLLRDPRDLRTKESLEAAYRHNLQFGLDQRSPGEGADSRAGCTRGRADVLFSQNPFGSVPRTGAHGREQGFGHEARPSVGEEGSLRWLREQLQDELKHRPEDPPGESPAGIDPVTFGHAAASFALRGAGSPPEPCSSTAAGRRRAPAPPSPELRSTSTWMFPEDFRHLGALRLPESPPPRRRQPAAEAGRAHDGERSVEQLDRWLMEWVGAHSQGWRDHQAGASPERDRARLHAGRSLRVAT